MIFTQELGSGGLGASSRAAACAQQLPPFGFPKIIDVSDDSHPREVAKLMLEVDDPANCFMTMGEATNPAFVYDSHYCNVDDARDARLLVCSFFEAGLRAFDIRDPYHPREVAYYKPPAQGTKDLPAPPAELYRLRRRHAEPHRGLDVVVPAHPEAAGRHGGGVVHLEDNGFQVVRFTNPGLVGADLLKTGPGDDVM